MPEAVLAPGPRIECRSAEWVVRNLRRSSDGLQVVDVVGVSPFLRDKEALFIVEVEQAAGSFKVLQPEDTELVSDPSPRYRDSLLFLEAHLRRTVPTDAALVVGHRAAMDALDTSWCRRPRRWRCRASGCSSPMRWASARRWSAASSAAS